MDYNQETTLAYKADFMDFLDQDMGQGLYMEKVRSMMAQGRHRLLVDLNDLRSFRADLARRLLHSPSDYLQPFADAVEEVTRNLDPKYVQEGEEMQVGFEGEFGFHKVNPRELLSPFLGHMVCVQGIVTKCSLVRPKVVKSVHFCPTTTEFVNREYRDITANSGLPTGAVYPTRDDHGNLLVTEFGLCKYRDHQTLSVQEMPENSAPGQLPRSVDVIAEDDLVDACKPGDRVAVVGVYKAIPGRSQGTVSGVFRTVLVANNISQLNKDIVTPIFTNEDIKNIKDIGSQENAFDLLGESLAPSIYGHSWIKKAVVLQLLSGMEKNLKNGTHIRGDINLMMVGDPSVAKSQLLRAIMNIAPLAISTTGRGSSGVGLTAAVTTDQETGERRLEAGAMVLADRGVVCIDEFDKMSDLDRVAIHEVMEQQTVTIAKAGIHASLNARCSVVAAANPIYGSYDSSITPTKNIGLPDSLLSRFDLLFIVLDQMDADIDRHISEHVLRMHRYRMPGDDGGMLVDAASRGVEEEEEVELGTAVYVKYNRLLHGERRTRRRRKETLTIKFLKKYIHYAKSRHTPVLTEEASEAIAQAYTEFRQATIDRSKGGGTLPITPRTLETMIRLSTAHAKLKLRNEVIKDDVEAALNLMHFAIYHTELNEMSDRREKENEQEQERESRRKRQAEATGPEYGPNGDDDDENGGNAGRQSSRRRRRSGPSGTANDPQEEAAPAPQPASAPSAENGHATRPGPSVEPAQETQATDITSIPQESLSIERQTSFHTAMSRHLMDTRISSIDFNELMDQVNQRNPAPFSRGEVSFALQEMQKENRVFISGNTIHIV